MNYSKSISLLKSIDLGVTNSKLMLDDINIELTSIDDNVSSTTDALTTSVTSYPFQSLSTLTNILSKNTEINTSLSVLNNINTSVNNIESDVDDLNKTKIYFNATLTDGSNNYLDRIDYSGSPIIFEWQNDKGSPVYIYDYVFAYGESTEPLRAETYHSTAFTSKIGAVNSGGTDFEDPYMTYGNNMYFDYGTNPKKTSTSDTSWCWRYKLEQAPVEIGISRKFGHYIAGDFTSSNYDTNPIGIVQGYYYQ